MGRRSAANHLLSAGSSGSGVALLAAQASVRSATDPAGAATPANWYLRLCCVVAAGLQPRVELSEVLGENDIIAACRRLDPDEYTVPEPGEIGELLRWVGAGVAVGMGAWGVGGEAGGCHRRRLCMCCARV